MVDLNQGCDALRDLESPEAKCAFLESSSGCNPEGFINYLHLFYCTLGSHPALGYLSAALWLALCFYLLGDTAAKYFRTNLEALSQILKLPPTLAGVTLLSLGNGAPDVFSAVASFLGDGAGGDVGLNGVLGGALFVTCVVLGAISVHISPRGATVDRRSFIRDACFLLLVLSLLLAVVAVGVIDVWASAAFTSLYVVYVLIVSVDHVRRKDRGGGLPTCHADLTAPLSEPNEPAKAINWVFTILDLILSLPRRVTIPDASKERWSKPFAAASVALAPVLLAAVWNGKRERNSPPETTVVFVVGGLTGLTLMVAVLVRTKRGNPPSSFLFPWLAGGFLMSVTWTYLIAEELVSLLVSLGPIMGLSPSVLGLTVLAWGNSLGDLVANIAVANGGGAGGVQVAFSGCYGGPIFNILVGLGLSLGLASWAVYPAPCAIPVDPTLVQTLGFLIGGLLWALFVLPRRGMMPDRVLGGGLIAIYLCFLCVRFVQALGLLHLL